MNSKAIRNVVVTVAAILCSLIQFYLVSVTVIA
jgi:hypothetical protein